MDRHMVLMEHWVMYQQTDFDYNPNTLEEAIKYQKSSPSSRTIPLYDKEGDTIGELKLETGHREYNEKDTK